MKTFVLDTNVILHDPYAMFAFKGSRVVIPLTVIEELDTFKRANDSRNIFLSFSKKDRKHEQ